MIKKLIRRFIKYYFNLYLKPLVEDCMLREYHVYGDNSKLTLAKTANVNNCLFNVASGQIVIEDYAFCGHNVCLIAGTHDYTKFDLQRQKTIPAEGYDILVKRGAWISSNVTVLGPCIIGEHSVIAAGSVVIRDVPPYAIVGGIPARVIKIINAK